MFTKGDKTINLPENILILWGNFIFMIGIFSDETNLFAKMIKYLIVDQRIINSALISQNHVFCVSEGENDSFLINFKDLTFGEFDETTKDQIDKFVPTNVKMPLNLLNSLKSKQLFSVANKNYLLFIDNQKIIQKITFTNWKTPILNEVKNKNFTIAMKLMIEIYKGNSRNFSNIPSNSAEKTKEMGPIIEEISKQYIKNYFESFWSVENSKNENSINFSKMRDENFFYIIMEFLIECEKLDYLFCKIYQDFEKMEKNIQFIECLEPFIIYQKIK